MSISFSSPVSRDGRLRGTGVTAVLGPTNTGKTHLAIERMLGHSSGMIGLPLRLLAREVYNTMVERLLRGANIVQRPRLSTLIHSGDKKISRLPRRSAIVAFSADEVYAIAELIRRQRGG